MPWPVVVASGGPRERGRRYGEQAAERAHRSVELYEQVFLRAAGLTWAEARRRAGAFVEAVDVYDHQLLPEIEGIAQGAALDAEDVLALNLRTEVMYGLGHARECTALCASPAAADGQMLLAQNWDWKPATAATCVLLICAPAGRPAFATLVEAGLLAKCGVNEAGIGLMTNALQSSLDRGEPGVPFHAILRKILTSGSFEAAVAAVTHADRASSANYLIGSRDGRAVDIEATPANTRLLEGEALAHANHFLWSDRGFKDLGLLEGGGTRGRQRRADAALAGGATSHRGFETTLRDHRGLPDSVCAHRNPALDELDDYVTIASVVADLTESTLSVSDGPPCGSAYERFALADLFALARGG